MSLDTLDTPELARRLLKGKDGAADPVKYSRVVREASERLVRLQAQVDASSNAVESLRPKEPGVAVKLPKAPKPA